MAYVSTAPVAVAHDGKGFFSRALDVLVRMAEADPRFQKLSVLSAMSDEELAKRGLRRDQIAREVLGGTYYV